MNKGNWIKLYTQHSKYTDLNWETMEIRKLCISLGNKHEYKCTSYFSTKSDFYEETIIWPVIFSNA